MKIIRYNLLLLEKRKLIYVVICILMMVSLTDVLMVFIKNYGQVDFIENSKTADYLSILSNPFISMAPILLFGFPILFNMLLSDSTWIELKQGNCAFIYTRLDYIKNILIRYFISIIIVFLLSCFCFLLNYISLSVIFGNGNILTNFQDLAFNIETAPQFFLDTVRISNPRFYSVLFILHVSILYGLISGISYALSFLFNKQILIYFSGLLFMIACEFIALIFRLSKLSIILQLQPFSFFEIKDALTLYLFLILFGMVTIFLFLFKKKDLLL